MKFSSAVYAQASGSQDGTTWSHNRYGRYCRRRATPTNPRSSRQVVVRAALSTLAATFPTLSGSARAAWDTYAQNVPRTDRLGASVNLTANAAYISANSGRVQFLGGSNLVNVAPTTYASIALTVPTTLTITTGTNVSVTPASSDTWTGNTNNACLVFASRPKSPSTNFFIGPYQQAGIVRGTSAANIVLPFTVASGNKVFFAFRVLGLDGRISDLIRSSATF